jgi:hypothetical protein
VGDGERNAATLDVRLARRGGKWNRARNALVRGIAGERHAQAIDESELGHVRERATVRLQAALAALSDGSETRHDKRASIYI